MSAPVHKTADGLKRSNLISWLTIKLDNEALATPKLSVMAVHQLLCPDGCLLVTLTDERAVADEMAVAS